MCRAAVAGHRPGADLFLDPGVIVVRLVERARRGSG